MKAENKFTIYFDGGTCGVNGKCDDGYGSWEVEWNGFSKRVEREPFLAAGVLHRVTNNVAEWLALKNALAWLQSVKDKGRYGVEIFGDSQLVLNQLTGAWKAKDANMRELRDHCLYYLNRFSYWTADWIPRAKNVKRFGH